MRKATLVLPEPFRNVLLRPAMFLVPTVVAPSRKHGVGVYAGTHLPANTLVWQFHEGVDLRLSEEVLSAVPPALQERLRRYCYREGERSYVLCMDNAKFMNHSFDPNCDDSGPEGTVTLRDIAEGEEMTCDYRLFDLDSARDGLEGWRGWDAALAGTSGP